MPVCLTVLNPLCRAPPVLMFDVWLVPAPHAEHINVLKVRCIAVITPHAVHCPGPRGAAFLGLGLWQSSTPHAGHGPGSAIFLRIQCLNVIQSSCRASARHCRGSSTHTYVTVWILKYLQMVPMMVTWLFPSCRESSWPWRRWWRRGRRWWERPRLARWR